MTLDEKDTTLYDVSSRDTNFMRVVERIQCKKSDALSQLCHTTKNLYNFANYLVRQRFTNKESKYNSWMRYNELYSLLKFHETYRNLPAQTAQQTLKLLEKNWKSFFNSIKDWKAHPNKYLGRPKLPKYLPKDGETIVIFTNQQVRIRNGILRFPKKTGLQPVKVRPHITEFHQVRVLPRTGFYIVEIVYDRHIQDAQLSQDRVISCDLGVNNLLTIANNVGLAPLIVKGRVIKSINQYFNKRIAHLRSILNKQDIMKNSNQINRLLRYRYNRLQDYFHKSSRQLIKYCKKHDIGTIIIGKNDGWKQNCAMGKRNNQNFIQIPFNTLISMIQYKAQLIGIRVILVTESHTSKCSAIDGEEIAHHKKYVGRRIHRGLFKSQNGLLMNADVNAAFNIMRRGLNVQYIQPTISSMLKRPVIISI